jgi:hypothetical protein
VAELAASLNIAEVDAEDAVDVVLFPPGRERPKRTAEEFRTIGGEEDGMELGEDLLELGGEMDLGAEGGAEEPVAEAEEAAVPAPKAKSAPKGKGEKKPAERKPAAEKRPAEKKAPARVERKPAGAKAEKKPAARKPVARPAKKPGRPAKKK